MRHGDQLKVIDEDGVVRFRENPIVRFLLDAGQFDLNQLACMPWSMEDRSHFAQLIGYSVNGYGDLSYAVDVDRHDSEAVALVANKPSGPGGAA